MKFSGHKFNERMLDDASVVIDIGALDGSTFTFPMYKKFNCTLHSYEPTEYNYNVILNNSIDIDKIYAYNYAVSDYNGETNFYVFGNGWNGGCNSLTNHEGKSRHKLKKIQNVEVISMDNILNGFEVVDLLKIDCEGEEIPILM